jgi:hypothetical protein
LNLASVGLGLNTSLAALFKLEMFDGSRHVTDGTADADLMQAFTSNLPAGPMKGLPAISSRSPDCSPTKTTFAFDGPSPNAVWVAFL